MGTFIFTPIMFDGGSAASLVEWLKNQPSGWMAIVNESEIVSIIKLNLELFQPIFIGFMIILIFEQYL
jgi:hypothetical protein